jgi:ATP-dependent Clp protease ATP-binding subunit ClpC
MPPSTERVPLSNKETCLVDDQVAPVTTPPSLLSADRSKAAEEGPIDRDTFPMLASLGRDLTHAAERGELEPVVGREREVEQALDVLAKRHANNPVLTGPTGVGKTSVAHGIAAELGKINKRLIEVNVSELLAGTGARGSLAERLAEIRDEVKDADGAVVLFIDELHELLDAGDEAVAELKMALSSGQLPIVGATSSASFRHIVEADPALARRFSEVAIEEPNEIDAFLLLRQVADALAKHHRVRITDEAIAVAVAWSIRYLPGRALPAKAVSLLDLAGARRRRRAASDRRPRIEEQHIAEVVAELAEVPIERLTQTDHDRMLDLEKLLSERVIGHDDACRRIAMVLRRNAAGLRGARPVGTFLLLGPTGVGKTETAKAVAEILFGAPDAMTRLDMSEYAEAHAVARLIGAPPGYIGHDAGGLLTEAVRQRPYQVILLDEIEKAHRDVLQVFLQVFDEGRLTDGRGRTIDLTNTVIVITSNLGASELSSARSERRVGFGNRDQGKDAGALRDVAIQAARATLPPELYNRIDEVLFFRHLEKADVRTIARRLLAGLAASLGRRGVRLDVSDEAIDALLESGGFDAELGARPMRRAITRLVEAPLADMILRGELPEGSMAMVSANDGAVIVDAVG